MPDPFLFCILLTAATYLLALGLTPTAPVALAVMTCLLSFALSSLVLWLLV